MTGVINLVIGCLLILGPVTESAVEVGDGRFPFLRRRTSSAVKRETISEDFNSKRPAIQADSAVIGSVQSEPVTKKKFISFGLRKQQPQLQEEQLKCEESVGSVGGFFSGFFSTAFSGITKVVDAIDELEHEFERMEVEQNSEIKERVAKEKRAEVVSKLIKNALDGFDHDDEEDFDSEVGSESSEEMGSNLSASGITIYNHDDTSSEEGPNSPVLTRRPFTAAIEALNALDSPVVSVKSSKSEVVEVLPEESTADFNADSNAAEDADDLNIESIEKIRADYVLLSDSDTESWEKIERNMVENVQVLVQKPIAVQLIRGIGSKESLIGFLASVFVKLAQRIFFKPPVQSASIKKIPSFDGFVTDFEAELAVEDVLNNPSDPQAHKILDFETAHRVLFYNESPDAEEDWCLLLPEQEDYVLALDHLSQITLKEVTQIDVDLPRLPMRYYDYYAERRGRAPLTTDVLELQDKIRYILAFTMAFESKELSTSSDSGRTTKSYNQPILYTQGFDQIAAYFAINFDMNGAGPLAYRFFQLYMAELINVKTDDLGRVRQRIDLRAVKMIRGYLRDQVGVTVLNFEALLSVLELYPFSDRSATILYFTSATSWTDLDRLVQFLILKVPQSQAHKCISLLAAANMLYGMLALDKLFSTELGSQEWAELKYHLSTVRGEERRNILDELVVRFMGELYLLFGDKIVHSGPEFDDFLLVAQSLVHYLQEFD